MKGFLTGGIIFLLLLQSIAMSATKNEILSTLQNSQKRSLMVMIKLRHQREIVYTTVEAIENDIVIVKPVQLQGVSLARNSFYMEEIEHVKCPEILFNAYLYTQLAKIQISLSNTREKVARIPHLQGV
jgi:hypothetical protein